MNGKTNGMGARLAAGGVVLRRVQAGSTEVLVVHRPRYDDWSLPKGKVDSGESLEQAALREVEEETGLKCRIIRKLAVARYIYHTAKGERPKAVHYYLMSPVGGDLRVHQDEEIDSVEWIPTETALVRLSYDFDRNLLRETLESEAP
jgi:8-oxo-dGTP pyrophosphatase MutT (NUDIX family)